MKIYCSRTDLNKALSNVSHSVPVRSTSSILEGILIEASDNTMKLTATDTNITIESVINVQCREECSFVVPAKLFTAIVNKLPEEDIMIDYDPSSVKIMIKCGGSNSELICFRSDDFPRIYINDGNDPVYLSKEDVKKLIKTSLFVLRTQIIECLRRQLAEAGTEAAYSLLFLTQGQLNAFFVGRLAYLPSLIFSS
jgi:DNA polymerase-3 subunit beta